MSPKTWGTPTWYFFHILAANIQEISFPLIGQDLIKQIIYICHNLPCPDCAMHATKFWKQVKIINIKTKNDLIDVLFVFHNIVNKRKNYPLFNKANLTIYENKNIIHAYNNFKRHFHTNNNMALINDSFRRNMMLQKLNTWLISNNKHFMKPSTL